MLYKTNTKYFEKWSPEMAYILGIIITDGYVTKNSIIIDLQLKDIAILEFIKSQISPCRPIYEYQKINKKTQKITNYNRLSLSSKKLAKSLSRFGIFQNKTGFESIPVIKKEMMPHLLRGIFDGDGSARIRNRFRKLKSGELKPYKEYEIKFVSASKSFLDDIKIICDNRGGKISLQKDKRPNRTMDFFTYRMNRKDGAVIRDFMYPNNEFGLKRKKLLLDQF